MVKVYEGVFKDCDRCPINTLLTMISRGINSQLGDRFHEVTVYFCTNKEWISPVKRVCIAGARDLAPSLCSVQPRCLIGRCDARARPRVRSVLRPPPLRAETDLLTASEQRVLIDLRIYIAQITCSQKRRLGNNQHSAGDSAGNICKTFAGRGHSNLRKGPMMSFP